MNIPRAALTVAVVGGVQLALVFAYHQFDARRSSPAVQMERVTIRPPSGLALLNTHGERVSLERFRGRPLLLHFWASWCPPCKREMPGLLARGRALASEGRARLVLVGMDGDNAAVRDFFQGVVPQEALRDEGNVAKAFGVINLPATFLVDAGGTARLRFQGERDWTSNQARSLLMQETSDGDGTRR